MKIMWTGPFFEGLPRTFTWRAVDIIGGAYMRIVFVVTNADYSQQMLLGIIGLN